MRQRQYVISRQFVTVPLRVDHLDLTWTLTPSTDLDQQGRAIPCPGIDCTRCLPTMPGEPDVE